MINVKNLTISQDGGFKKISIMWDEVDNTGRITGTNMRATRAVTEQNVLDAIIVLMNHAEAVIEEDK